MSEFFELAPKHILKYFGYVASLITTIPLRFSILADTYDDHEYSQFEEVEFIWNKSDILYKMIS